MLADDYAGLQEKISQLISEFDDPDGLKRQKARLELIAIGWDAVPSLIEVVSTGKGQARWEAIESLARIRDPEAAPVLLEALLDEDTGIRWAASRALIELDRAALQPLMVALTKHFDSIWFREVAHHILHVLRDRHRLLPNEIKVMKALESIEPMVEVPWAAKTALEDLEHTRRKK